MDDDNIEDVSGLFDEIEIPPYSAIGNGFEGFLEYSRANDRNRTIIAEFLGKRPQTVVSYTSADYYAHLLAWAVKRVTSSSRWRKFSDYVYSFASPVLIDIQTDYDEYESCLINGQSFLSKENFRIVVSISLGKVQIEVTEEHLELANNLLQEIKDYMSSNNIYKNKKIVLGDDTISFLDVKERLWDSIVLDPDIKSRIWENSIGFLKNIDRMQEYGITPRTGICLSGEPGTGKTIITRALMSEAENITCITASPYSVLSGGYISELFELAQDLSPTILCIEDIDSLGMERTLYYHGTPTYLALLQEMDGLEEKTAIVTIGTTNLLETIDAALLRPSRFGCIIQLPKPSCELRSRLVDNVSREIFISEDLKSYIAKKTDGFTPAEIQGVLHNMAITRIVKQDATMNFVYNDVDTAISQIKFRATKHLGFNAK